MKLSMQTIRCIRIRVSDGGAKLFVLLHSSKEMLSQAIDAALAMIARHLEVGRQDFGRLASQFTLHGPLLVLKYLLGDELASWSKQQARQVLLECGAVLALCSPFVCDQTLERFSENVAIAPDDDEGGSDLEDEDEDEEDAASGGSHVRVCAWRGVREACLVVGEAMNRLLPLLEQADVLRVADELLTIVLKSKHRGALENASIGLEMTCTACLKSSEWARALPQQWLERVLSFDAKSIGTVRRSAGIPYAICIILRSEWNAFSRRDCNMPLVGVTMTRLLSVLETASLDQQEPRSTAYYRVQVHHLNILRHIIRDSSLADQLRPYLETLLLISLKMWNHNEWSIRNSASLLFAAAMRKLDPRSIILFFFLLH